VSPATDAQVIQLGLRRCEACLDVSRAFPVRRQRKGPAEERIPAGEALGEALDLVAAFVAVYVLAAIVNRPQAHRQEENMIRSEFIIHLLLWRCTSMDSFKENIFSSMTTRYP